MQTDNEFYDESEVYEDNQMWWQQQDEERQRWDEDCAERAEAMREVLTCPL